jgi:glycosyltransferase involved in cell wall biosynthesis
MMQVQIHTLSWENNNPIILETHKKVMSHFDIPVFYTIKNANHGQWMNSVLSSTTADIIIFLDVDCVPLKREFILETIGYCQRGYLVGNAQVTNCIKAKHDLFCAPSFIGISKEMYENLGRPNCINNERSDVGQEITRAAVEKEKRIKMYFPSSFQEIPSGGIWRLSSYGYYGIGTLYENKIYHLYQSRLQRNIDLFVQTCNHILEGTIDRIDKKYDSRSEWMNILPIEDEYGV